MKIKVALLDKDKEYLDRLTGVFNTKYADKLEVYSFTDEKNAIESVKEYRIDVLIAEEDFNIDKSEFKRNCGLAYFTGTPGIELIKDEIAICKYQRVDVIFKQILGVYSDMAYSDLKNVSADFVIDKTAPTFTISGIEEDGNYRGTSQNVTLVPTDDGGKLGHVKVTILDKDGKEQKVISDMSGDELTKYLNGNDGKIKFKVPEGVNQQVAILCADCSIGTDGGTNTTDFIYKGITVSSNAFILFFENKPLFYGVLGVVAAAIIVPTGFVIYKKKRKTKKEASEQ